MPGVKEATMTTETQQSQSRTGNDGTILLKRQVTVKTLVNDNFRDRAKSELGEEQRLIETQLQQLDAQYQHSLQQLEAAAHQGQNVQKQLQQLEREAQQKRSELAGLRMQVSSQAANLEKVENGQYVITGLLENTVELRVGDNIYDRLQNAEILVEDGVVTAIRG